MIQLEHKEIKTLKEKWHLEQDEICPVLNQYFPLDKMCLDHQHKLKAETADETGKGLCRGVIQFQANAWEGKVTNSFKRMGLDKYIDFVSALRNLADYIEYNKIQEGELVIHPNEKPPKPTLTKTSYNKLVKKIDGKCKVPEYKAKKGNLTKPLVILFEKYNLTPEFKKD